MYIVCVILCLFGALSRRVGALQISIIIIIIIVAAAAAATTATVVRRCSYFHAEAAFPN